MAATTCSADCTEQTNTNHPQGEVYHLSSYRFSHTITPLNVPKLYVTNPRDARLLSLEPTPSKRKRKHKIPSTLQSPNLPVSLSFSLLDRFSLSQITFQSSWSSTMKKLYRKGTVHPSPPTISDHLSFLPATILTLAAALSPEDREVLAYLISCSNNNISVNNFQTHQRKNTTTTQKSVSFAKSKGSGAAGSSSSGSNSNNNDHPSLFNCDCFRCYTSYWVRWDASPNRQLIHEIIDAFEDELLSNNKKAMKSNKKDKKKKGGNLNSNSGELKQTHQDQLSSGKEKMAESEPIEESSSPCSSGGDAGKGCGGHDQEGEEKGHVRSFVNFIGERIWGVWG